MNTLAQTSALLLTLHALKLSRGDKTLLDNLSLQCRAGERWAVLGLNGVGKSSLLDTISGFLMPEQGEVIFTQEHREISTHDCDATQLAQLRSHVSQRYSPRFAMTVQAFVEQGAEGDASKAKAWIAALDLDALMQRDITQLSGGELQRATLARHLARERQLVLLDEPMTHLDPAHQQQLLALLRGARLAHGCVIAAVHDINWAQAFATHVLILGEQGNWLAGTVDEVMNESTLSQALHVKLVKVNTESGPRWVI